MAALIERWLATADLSPVEAPEEWEGEARLREIPARIAELMTAFNGGALSGAIVFPQAQALEAEPARLQAEHPVAAPRPRVSTPEAFAALDPDRRRAGGGRRGLEVRAQRVAPDAGPAGGRGRS